MTTERLTQAQLEAIRVRAVTSLGGSWYAELIENREDVTLLLAEVERLRLQMNDLGRFSQDDLVWELIRRDVELEAMRNDNE